MVTIKEYVVLSSHFQICALNFNEALKALKPITKRTNCGVPIYKIETNDGTLIYFTTDYMWRGKYSLGRNDVKEVRDYVFIDALRKWVQLQEKGE